MRYYIEIKKKSSLRFFDEKILEKKIGHTYKHAHTHSIYRLEVSKRAYMPKNQKSKFHLSAKMSPFNKKKIIFQCN